MGITSPTKHPDQIRVVPPLAMPGKRNAGNGLQASEWSPGQANGQDQGREASAQPTRPGPGWPRWPRCSGSLGIASTYTSGPPGPVTALDQGHPGGQDVKKLTMCSAPPSLTGLSFGNTQIASFLWCLQGGFGSRTCGHRLQPFATWRSRNLTS